MVARQLRALGGRNGIRPPSLTVGNGGSPTRPGEAPEERVATGLGWFSVGLGLAQLLAPRALSRLIGLRGDSRDVLLMRFVGMRELGAAVAIFTRLRPSGALWARVAGDTMDLALLGAAFASKKSHKGQLAAATAAVAGVTALDVFEAMQLSGNKRGAGGRDMQVTKVITVNRPPEEVYGFWQNFENFPRFMSHLESVQTNGNGRSHWKATGPAGTTVEWDAELVEDRPNELLAWRSVAGAEVENAGAVRFTPAPGGRGTEVRVDLEYSPPAGVFGAAVAKLFGQAPEQQMDTDLRAFKQVMELGEVVHSDASIHAMPHPARPPESVPGR